MQNNETRYLKDCDFLLEDQGEYLAFFFDDELMLCVRIWDTSQSYILKETRAELIDIARAELNGNAGRPFEGEIPETVQCEYCEAWVEEGTLANMNNLQVCETCQDLYGGRSEYRW